MVCTLVVYYKQCWQAFLIVLCCEIQDKHCILQFKGVIVYLNLVWDCHHFCKGTNIIKHITDAGFSDTYCALLAKYRSPAIVCAHATERPRTHL